MRASRRAHLIVAWALVAGVVVQVFLAGLGVFESATRFDVHVTWGYTLEILPLLLLGLAAAGRLGRRQMLYAAGLFGMFLLQSLFVGLRADMPWVAALHPVNGFAILLVSVAAARESWAAREFREGTAAVTESAPGVAGSG
jgi:hypothetical protein